MKNLLMKAALKYQSIGYSVIPVQANKKPYLKWEPYKNDVAGQGQIKDWWGRWPNASIGLVCGKVSGVDVVDVDSEAGWEAINEFLSDSFQTPICKSPKGYHVYFSHRPGLSNGVRVLNDCDLRTDGGYIIAPPSRNGSGKAYVWLKGLKVTDIPLAGMPEILFDTLATGAGMAKASSIEHKKKVEYINKNILSSSRGIKSDVVTDNKSQQLTTSDNIRFDKGYRDNSLFHLANHLAKSGMPNASIEKYLQFFGAHCNPPFPSKEVSAKIQSALQRSQNRDRNLTQDIRDIFLTTSGNITTTFVYQMTTLTTREDRKKAAAILSRMVQEGFIERVAGVNGTYRRLERECEAMDFMSAESETMDLWLPFGIDQMVEIMPGNIIVVAGEPDSGKTAFMLNIVKENQRQPDFEIHYFNSEMGASELKKRLSKFNDIALSDWRFKPWERSGNFGDVIKPGKGKINIIDFLEIHDNFYEVGGKMAEIHNKLKGAIAIIALQKNPGTDTGLGGFRGLEKPRLYITMSRSNYCKIVKAKNWATSENPNGKMIRYKIYQGCNLYSKGDWHKETN